MDAPHKPSFIAPIGLIAAGLAAAAIGAQRSHDPDAADVWGFHLVGLGLLVAGLAFLLLPRAFARTLQWASGLLAALSMGWILVAHLEAPGLGPLLDAAVTVAFLLATFFTFSGWLDSNAAKHAGRLAIAYFVASGAFLLYVPIELGQSAYGTAVYDAVAALGFLAAGLMVWRWHAVIRGIKGADRIGAQSG